MVVYGLKFLEVIIDRIFGPNSQTIKFEHSLNKGNFMYFILGIDLFN